MDDKKRIEVLEQRLKLYEEDGAMRAYYALKRIVNAQVNFINQFDITAHIGTIDKDDKMYERTEKLWKGLKDLITDLNALKEETKATDNEQEDLKSASSFLDTFADAK